MNPQTNNSPTPPVTIACAPTSMCKCRRRHCRLLIGFLLFCLTVHCPDNAFAQPPPAGTPLTAAQRSELDSLMQKASSADRIGDYATAQRLLEELLNKAQLLKCQPYIADALSNLGGVNYIIGQMDKAADFDNLALELYRKLDNARGIAFALTNLGNVYVHKGLLIKASDAYSQSLNTRLPLGRQDEVAVSLTALGNVSFLIGEYNKAVDYYQKAMAADRSQETIAQCQMGIGNVYEFVDQFNQALEYHTKALVILRSTGKPQDIAKCLNNIGSDYRAMGQIDKSLDFYTRAVEIQSQQHNREGVAMGLTNLM